MDHDTQWFEKSKQYGRYRNLTNRDKMLVYALRDNPTMAEEALWNVLRNKQFFGLRFRRQHKIGRYVADFFCHRARLVIEVDGGIHEKRQIEDGIRTDFFKSIGLFVVRFTNEDVLGSIKAVKARIASHPSVISLFPLLNNSAENTRCLSISPPSGDGGGI
jgi:very-short-patch-repair endonuclease